MATTDHSSLKILHIVDHSLPLYSGYAFRSQNIFEAQLKRGWQPVALTSPKHEESWKGESEPREEIEGIRYYRTGPVSHPSFPLAAEWQIMSALVRRIREVAEIEKPDLLHAHSPILNALPALRVGRQLGIPVVYEIRAFWEDAAVDHGTYGHGSWRYRLVKSLETWVCRRADQVVVLCQGLKNDLLERGIPPENLTVVPSGVNVDDFKACEPNAEYGKTWKLAGKKVIGFIGSFYRYEGLDLLIEAVARLAVTTPNTVLLLVGGGEREAELKAHIKRLNLEEKVILPGRIPSDRIPGVYTLVDILVYPRYSMRLTELVTPLKPLEAMAMGKALVASDIGGHREIIRHGHTGLLFPAGDVSALTETLKRLLDDPDFRHNLEGQEIAWVRQMRTWDRTTAAYIDVYGRALDKRRVREKISRTPADSSVGSWQTDRETDLG